MRFALPILVAALVAAFAGYRASRLTSVAAYLPGWMWPVFWTCIGALLLMVPALSWLDF